MYKTNHLYQAIHEKNERDGEQGEKQALPILNKYFDANFSPSPYKYSPWDFIDTKKKTHKLGGRIKSYACKN